MCKKPKENCGVVGNSTLNIKFPKIQNILDNIPDFVKSIYDGCGLNTRYGEIINGETSKETPIYRYAKDLLSDSDFENIKKFLHKTNGEVIDSILNKTKETKKVIYHDDDIISGVQEEPVLKIGKKYLLFYIDGEKSVILKNNEYFPGNLPIINRIKISKKDFFNLSLEVQKKIINSNGNYIKNANK